VLNTASVRSKTIQGRYRRTRFAGASANKNPARIAPDGVFLCWLEAQA
jgi:hypothetical protein